MILENFYLICFFLGLALSAVSFFSGALHWHLPVKLHLPTVVSHSPALGHLGMPKVSSAASSAGDIPFFNASSLMAFLCWFGGMGYLLTHYSRIWFAAALALSALTGLGGAALVFWFLVKVLMKHERPLNAEDFEMVGVVGVVTNPIRAGGTGEIVFLQQGTRRVSGARSEARTAVLKGAEVVVTRYEKGIAYVRLWEQFADEHQIVAESTEQVK